MSDAQNIDGSQGAVNGGQKPSQSASQPLPFFKRRGKPSVFSVSDMNRLVTLLNKLANTSYAIVPALQDVTGNAIPGFKITDSETNRMIELALGTAGNTGSGSGGGGGFQVARFQIQNLSYIYGDYLIAADIDNVYGGGNFRIAKPWKLRNSITSATIDGTAFTYTYTTPIERSVYVTGPTLLAYERISPRYVANDYILAMQTAGTNINGGMVNVADVLSSTPGISTVNWLDLNIDARAWADNFDQSAP